jgi:NodT family efflux transporter outer membrane factor (OMF) lipoprotein
MSDIRFHRSFAVSALAGSALLAGCASLPVVGPAPVPRAPQSFVAERSLGATSSVWPGDRWWAAYGDPQLDRLIEEGLASAPALAAAAARVRAAEAVARQAGAARLPRVDAQGSVSAVKQSYNNAIPRAFVPQGINDTGEVALNLGFDLDLWGRNRAALAAATSQAEAARIEAAEASLLLSTNIAAAYADLARFHATRAVQQEAVTVRERTARLVSDRVAAGLDTQAEARQAAAAVPTARAELLATDEQIALTRNRIAALIGQGPDRGLAIVAPAARVQPHGIPAGITTDLIGRRPDIAAARARVEAAASRIKVARADFYPSVNLSALVGLQSFGLGNLVNSGSTFLNAGPALSLPIFRGGQLQGQYREARAGYDEAVAQYDGAVAAAFRDVADAATSQRALAARLVEQRQALVDSEAAYAVARQRFEGGLSTFLDVLTAEDRVLQARRGVADLQARAFTLDVALVRALGGGFAVPSKTTPTLKDKSSG